MTAKKNGLAEVNQSLTKALDDYFAALGDRKTSANSLHRMVVGHIEAHLIDYALRRAARNHTRAAAILGMSRSTLRAKIAKHGLAPPKAAAGG